MAATRRGTTDLTEFVLHAAIVALGLVCVFTFWSGYGLGMFGFCVGLMGMVGSCVVLGNSSRLREPTCCSFCCCFCPECIAMSNAWHLRNLSVAVCVGGAAASFCLMVIGLSYLETDACTYVCVMPEWNCRSCTEAYDLDYRFGINTCCAWGDAQRAVTIGQDGVDTSPESLNLRTDAFCSGATPMLTCHSDSVSGFYVSCQDVCDCVQGTLQEKTCYSYGLEGGALLVNGIAVGGIALMSVCAMARYNTNLRTDGIAGMTSFGSDRGETYANIILGSQSRFFVSGGTGSPGDSNAMVVGQPVMGEPSVAVATGLAVPGFGARGSGSSGAGTVVEASSLGADGSGALEQPKPSDTQ